MEVNFTKMQGLGNDFILIDSRSEKLDGIDLKKLAMDICDRHFGVGADGVLIIHPSQKAHYRMQIFNPDGSEPEMCGNGIRCFARFIYEKDKLKEEVISVETLAGIILPAMILDQQGKIASIEVDMGAPRDEGETALQGFKFRKISMGNPHAVAFVDELSNIDLAELGPLVEMNSHFPNRTNVEFVKVLSNKELKVLVWERGAGETLACGTGACAALAAAVLSGKAGRRAIVDLPGGKLDVEWNEENHILMRGPAEFVFEGVYHL